METEWKLPFKTGNRLETGWKQKVSKGSGKQPNAETFLQNQSPDRAPAFQARKPKTNTMNNTINQSKTVAVRILGSCLIRGQHLEAGNVFEMNQDDADDILRTGRGQVLRVRPSQSSPATPTLLEAA